MYYSIDGGNMGIDGDNYTGMEIDKTNNSTAMSTGYNNVKRYNARPDYAGSKVLAFIKNADGSNGTMILMDEIDFIDLIIDKVKSDLSGIDKNIDLLDGEYQDYRHKVLESAKTNIENSSIYVLEPFMINDKIEYKEIFICNVKEKV
jgi:hypothetical protein